MDNFWNNTFNKNSSVKKIKLLLKVIPLKEKEYLKFSKPWSSS